jgi:hypothetical protein
MVAGMQLRLVGLSGRESSKASKGESEKTGVDMHCCL